MLSSLLDIEVQRSLTDRDFAILTSETNLRCKHTGLAYALFILFGWIGLHKYYLGENKMGIVYSILGFLALPLLLLGKFLLVTDHETSAFVSAAVGIVSLSSIPLGIMLLVDLFTLHQQVDNINMKLQLSLYYKLTGRY